MLKLSRIIKLASFATVEMKVFFNECVRPSERRVSALDWSYPNAIYNMSKCLHDMQHKLQYYYVFIICWSAPIKENRLKALNYYRNKL